MSQTAEKAFELIQAAHAFLISGALGSGKEEPVSRIISLVNAPADTDGTALIGDPAVLTS
ncbi:MAG: hypothetical protein ACSHX9_03585 [Luteolibacter sp.]